MTYEEVSALLSEMMIEDTGRALCDSGDIYGRGFERNQKCHPSTQPDVEIDYDGEYFIVNTYKWLASRCLSLDKTCEIFNDLNDEGEYADDYIHSKSKEDITFACRLREGAREYLQDRMSDYVYEFDTYNSDYCVTDDADLVFLDLYDEDGYTNRYVLISIHLGCDIRGGWGTVRMFRVDEDFALPSVSGTLEREDGTHWVDNREYGYKLSFWDSEDSDAVDYDYRKEDNLELHIDE